MSHVARSADPVAHLIDTYSHELDVQLEGMQEELRSIGAEVRDIRGHAVQELEQLRVQAMEELKEILSIEQSLQTMPRFFEGQIAQIRGQMQVLGQRLEGIEAYREVKENQGWFF